MGPTHYEILEVSESATQDEIKKAYRRLAKKYHPDRNKNKGAEEKFKKINLAYHELGDPGRRQIYDYDLGQSRKAGRASGSSSAGTSAPPPPPPPPPKSAGGRKTRAAPVPPPAQSAYRYLFFLRGAFVGGAVVGVVLLLAVGLYVSCRGLPPTPSAAPTASATLPESVSIRSEEPSARISNHPDSAPTPSEPTPATQEEIPTPEPTPTDPEPTPTIPEPTPVTPEPTPTRPEPTPVRPEPTATPEPTPPEPVQTPVPPPVHLCGKWRGSFDWHGTRVPFFMRLEQRGNEISGVWTETQRGRLWRATIQGSVTGSTVAFVKRYGDRDFAVSFVSPDSSPESLRGTWETPQERGSWQAEWESELGDGSRNES